MLFNHTFFFWFNGKLKRTVNRCNAYIYFNCDVRSAISIICFSMSINGFLITVNVFIISISECTSMFPFIY